MSELDQVTQSMRSIFVFTDLKAENFLGQQLFVSRHPAPIIREFYSHLGNPQTAMAQHPEDYNVLHIGYIEDDGNIIPIKPLIVATGAAWAAARTPEA